MGRRVGLFMSEIRKAAVIGAGTMGSGIASHLANAGVPVLLLDVASEMDILGRDLATMKKKYEVDPNLIKIASYFSVLTRLLPPFRSKIKRNWPDEKEKLYKSITPEQKLFLYAAQPEEPAQLIQRLPHWHTFRSELIKL